MTLIRIIENEDSITESFKTCDLKMDYTLKDCRAFS